MENDDKSIHVIEQLFDDLHENGVSVKSVTDGHIFMFSLQKLEEIVVKLRRDKEENCIVFVRTKLPSNQVS